MNLKRPIVVTIFSLSLIRGILCICLQKSIGITGRRHLFFIYVKICTIAYDISLKKNRYSNSKEPQAITCAYVNNNMMMFIVEENLLNNSYDA